MQVIHERMQGTVAMWILGTSVRFGGGGGGAYFIEQQSRCRWMGCVYAHSNRKGISLGRRWVSLGDDLDPWQQPLTLCKGIEDLL